MIISNLKTSVVFALVVLPFCSSYSEELIDYPQNYRSWDHVKTAVITETHPLYETFGGIHHVYANDPALRALKGKLAYPDGSVFVFDLMVAQPVDGIIGEGTRRRLDVMEKNKKRFSSTGDWGYGSFKESTQQLIEQNVVQNCFGCHASQLKKDYVFSDYRE